MSDADRVPVLAVRDLCRVFRRKGFDDAVAVEGASFKVYAGECVGLVGESGSGKSTIARMVTRLIDVTSGQVLLCGCDITRVRGAKRRAVYESVQMVFQDPAGSFDPRRTLGAGIMEGPRNCGVDASEARRRALNLLARCGLPKDMMDRYPREVSGGQCQRAAIARALAMQPDLLVCDEATSALDVTVQRQIVQLLDDIRRDTGMALLFICHDLALVSQICDHVVVMGQHRVVEVGPTVDVINNPQSEHTRRLLAAVL